MLYLAIYVLHKDQWEYLHMLMLKILILKTADNFMYLLQTLLCYPVGKFAFLGMVRGTLSSMLQSFSTGLVCTILSVTLFAII